jgi:hypothetical protein
LVVGGDEESAGGYQGVEEEIRALTEKFLAHLRDEGDDAVCPNGVAAQEVPVALVHFGRETMHSEAKQHIERTEALIAKGPLVVGIRSSSANSSAAQLYG